MKPVLADTLEQDPNNPLSDGVPETFDNLRDRIRKRVANVRQQVADNNQPPPRS